MRYYKIRYSDDSFEWRKSESLETLIDEMGFWKPEHYNTRVFELSGEQLAIAIANEEYDE